jgi:NitT/TauT family transport system substrate-binding protein
MISRRAFVTGLGALAGTSATGPLSSGAAEPPPETTTIRLHRPPTIGSGVCLAPQWVAEDLLMGEGFTDVRYSVTGRVGANRALAAGDIDITLGFVGNWIMQVDSGDPIVVLGGGHIGCFELFASDRVRTIRDLKGKTIGVTEIGSGRHVFLLSLLSYVGMDPSKDVTLITHPPAECVKLFAAGEFDAYQAFAERVQRLRSQEDRARDHEQHHGPAVVAVLLLYAGR